MRVNTRLINKSIELWTKINPSGPFGEFSVFLLTTDRPFSFSTSIGSCHAVLVVILTGNSNYTGPAKRSACIIGIMWTNEKRNIWTLSVTNIYTFPLTENLHNIVWSTFFCQLPSLAHARLFSAAASPFSRLRSDCSLEITHSLRKTKETKQHKTSLTTNLTTNLTLTIVHQKRKRIN